MTYQKKEDFSLFSMKNNTILMDVDDVVANLVDEWLHIYNELANDNVTSSEVTDWDIAKFVKPDWKSKIYDILRRPNLYDSVTAVDGALDGIKRLIGAGHRVVYVTAPIMETSGSKYFWLQKNGFPISPEDYVEAKDKSLIYGDFLIDDGIHNIEATRAPEALLFTRPWNRNYEGCVRVGNWQEIMEYFLV